MNLVNHLAERAVRHPDRTALIDTEQSMTYGELYACVCAGSKQFCQHGFVSGDTVLILQPVSIPLYITLLSAFHAGLTVMFIDPSAGKTMIRNSLTLHPPQAFIAIVKAHLLRLTVPEIRRINKHFHSSGWVPFSKKWKISKASISATTTFHDPVATPPDSPALITFTSGSTGLPKAACRTHGFLLAQHEALAESLDYHGGEVDLVTLPVFTLANLASGLTSVLADTDLAFPAKANSHAIAEQCQRHQVTRCAASPAFFEKLHRDKQLPDFISIYTGGAPVFPNMLDEIQSSKPDMNVITVYGSTEAEPISHTRWQDVTKEDRAKMFSGSGLLVGKPVSATELRIIPDQSGQNITPMSKQDFVDLHLPAGETGEIVVSGDHVLKGYLHGKGDEENKIQVADSIWHRTGDAGWLDPSGKIWLMGRCSAAIRRPGQQAIYPFGIECAAMAHSAVKRCALVLYNEKITLFVEEELEDKQTSNLASLLQNLPVEDIQCIAHIPVDKRHNAKIDYSALLAELP